MTVIGDDIILNCRECFSSKGYGLRLSREGNQWVCPHDRNHRYVVERGMLKKSANV